MLTALKKTKGGDLYQLRARIAARLQTICAKLIVAPQGVIPQIKRQIKMIERESPGLR